MVVVMAHTVSSIISDDTLSAIIHIESGGRPTAKAPTSSASGLGQFINGTWLAVVAKHRPKWATGRSEAELLELNAGSVCSRWFARSSVEMLARFTEDNARTLGAGWQPGDLYLAHFAGVGTARMLLRIAPHLPASSVFSPKAIAANHSILSGKTCGDVRAWAAKKMKQASGRNWIAVHWSGAKPVLPAKEKAKAGAVVTGGVGAGAGTVQTGIEQGWGAMEWTLVALSGAAVIAAVIFAVRWWHKRNQIVKIEQMEFADGLVKS
jgi:hypothetical protein